MIKRWKNLDGLRGLAALLVVVWHWSHFSNHGQLSAVDFSPFGGLLWPFYRFAWLAVDCFFIISGFIFYALYSQSIGAGMTGSRQFFVKRFARLYPLHLFSLVFVAFGQQLYLVRFGVSFVYPDNGISALFPNLLLLNSYYMGWSHGLNQPSWSISVEVGLYLVFFIVSRIGWARLGPTLLFVLTGYVIIYPLNALVGRGFGGFFLGGLVYGLLSIEIPLFWRRCVDAFCFSVAGFLVLVLFILCLVGPQVLPFSRSIVYFTIVAVFFPTLVYSLARLDMFGVSCNRWLTSLGDRSYSLYLLHFPLQLVAATVFGGTSFYYYLCSTKVGFIAFLMVLNILAYFCYHKVEIPVQKWLHRSLSDKLT